MLPLWVHSVWAARGAKVLEREERHLLHLRGGSSQNDSLNTYASSQPQTSSQHACANNVGGFNIRRLGICAGGLVGGVVVRPVRRTKRWDFEVRIRQTAIKTGPPSRANRLASRPAWWGYMRHHGGYIRVAKNGHPGALPTRTKDGGDARFGINTQSERHLAPWQPAGASCPRAPPTRWGHGIRRRRCAMCTV